MKKVKDLGKPFVDRKQTAAITDDEITRAVIEGISKMASSSHTTTCLPVWATTPSDGRVWLLGQRSAIDLIQEIPQRLSPTNPTHCISRFGVGASIVRKDATPATQSNCLSTNRKWGSEDCESGCTFACAVDKVPGDFPCSVICKRIGVLWQEESRAHNGTASMLSALNAAVCHARTENTILENSLLYSSASIGAIEAANHVKAGSDQDNTRTTGTDAEDRDQHHSVVPWVVRHANVKVDGCTP